MAQDSPLAPGGLRSTLRSWVSCTAHLSTPVSSRKGLEQIVDLRTKKLLSPLRRPIAGPKQADLRVSQGSITLQPVARPQAAARIK